MHQLAIDRARERLAEATAGRPREADVTAALERTHTQLSELSRVTAGLEAELPEQVAAAVRDGVRREAAPVGRQLAEVRGMAVQMRALNLFADKPDNPVAQFLLFATFLGHLFPAQFNGFSHSHDAAHVLSGGPAAVLLVSA